MSIPAAQLTAEQRSRFERDGFSGGAPTSTLSFAALSEPILDRLDTKSDASDLKIIVAVFISAVAAR